MKSSVLIISSPFAGHLNKSTIIAKYYQTQGAEVTYLIYGSADWFKDRVEFLIIESKSTPIGVKYVPESEKNGKSQSLTDEIAQYHFRREELLQILEQTKPTLILIDEFCVSDYVILQPHLNGVKCVVLVPTLPNIPNYKIPPLSSDRYPHCFAWTEWISVYYKRLLKNRNLNTEDGNPNMLKSLRKAQSIEEISFRFRFYANRYPVFEGQERWYLSPEEFDFYPRKLPSNYRYLGPAIDFSRKEETHPRVSVFLKQVELNREKSENKSANEAPKVIFCGFGTVIRTYFSDDELIAFYQKINELARRHASWFFLIAIPSVLIDKVTPSCFNIMFVKHVPQLKVLAESDLFITHGGGSVLEGLHAGVPMLCLPAGEKVDYRGNGARIQYHGLGLVSTLEASIDNLEKNVTEILENASYRESAKKFGDMLNQKYGEGYLGDMNLPKA